MPHGNHNLSCCQPTNSNRFKLFHVMQESNVLLLTPSGQASIVGKPAQSHEISYIIQPNIKRETTLTTCPLLYFRNVRKKERMDPNLDLLPSFSGIQSHHFLLSPINCCIFYHFFHGILKKY